ncbi:MAG: amidohydrolase family protein [Longimicrobiales bacterium]
MRSATSRSARRRPYAPLAVVVVLVAAACGGPSMPNAVAYHGARVITGDGAVIEDATLIVENGVFTAVGPSSAIDGSDAGTQIDMSGKTVMPTLNNAHFHLPSERAARTAELQQAAYYGAGAASSFGLDEGTIGLEMRSESIPDAARSQSAGRGITSPEPGRSEVPYWVTTEDEARAAVQELAALDVDIVKIWVDDRGGRYERLSPELYGAVIDEAHANGLRVTAHVFRLEDAKGLLEAGIDQFAHGIRDMDVDDEVIEMWKARPEVVLIPNLPGPGVPAGDLSWMSGTVPAERIAQMEANQSENPAAQEAFGIQARNLVRLHAEGIRVAFGTDGGNSWTVHQELEDMVRAGLSPADVIAAATSTAAATMELDDTGAIAVGKSADFIVLDANPLDDITHTRMISDVYLYGSRVDRAGISSRLLGG